MKPLNLSRIAMYTLLGLFLVLTAYPFVWMLLSSFKTNTEMFTNPWGLPTQWTGDNYAGALHGGIQVYLWNSLVVAALTVVGTLVTSSMVSFYLARHPFPFSGWFVGLFLAGMLIPFHSTLIPVFTLMSKVGLRNNLFGLVLPYIAMSLPMAVFLSYGFFRQLPKELDEAATLDGCGVFRTFWQILLPLTAPVMATVVVLTAIGAWNEFIMALVLLSDDAVRTIPVGLMSFKGTHAVDYTGLSAALSISSVPVIVLYFFTQDFVQSGVTAGAVKG